MSNTTKPNHNIVGRECAGNRNHQQTSKTYTASYVRNLVPEKPFKSINMSNSFEVANEEGEIFKDKTLAETPDLVCLSHLRWDFVYQRPQHLLSRCAQERRVFFIEEPIFSEDTAVRLEVGRRADGVTVVVPYLPSGLSAEEVNVWQEELLHMLFAEQKISRYVLWYYTPMALAWTRRLQPLVTVYDCMDELSAFKHAPAELKNLEIELLERADLVFTGGQSLYEAKRDRHPSVHAFPSSVDVNHFAQARRITTDPADQANIPHPRLGFFGVIDERMDIDLLKGLAAARPDWHLVIIGPVVKVDPAALPVAPNIHYLGGKDYKELPAYLAGWDVALLPFARNESTRFISPTKTPEYLAAGKPVISTSIRDVVRPYGQQGLTRIADTVPEFVAAVEAAMNEDASARIRQADEFLKQTSWDRTWARMWQLIANKLDARQPSVAAMTATTGIKQAVRVATAAAGGNLPART